MKLEAQKGWEGLLKVLDKRRPVVVQPHNFPDHDALGSAFALDFALDQAGFDSRIIFEGTIHSPSLLEAVKKLNIKYSLFNKDSFPENSQIVVVDGAAGNSNVTELPGELVGIVDHHKKNRQYNLAFCDIRAEYGSCSTLIYEYLKGAMKEPPADLATALLLGILMDTAFFTRNVGAREIKAFGALHGIGDFPWAVRSLQNSLSINDIAYFREAINSCRFMDDTSFVILDSSCSQEVLGILADYFLHLREIDFSLVGCVSGNDYQISVRSEDAARPAHLVIKKLLEGIGSGGGHRAMAGGFIPGASYPGADRLYEKFKLLMKQKMV
jgi:nanoRNase/pAp phosphatase (c-di-AMP/oligoRNAs hydrolase)